MITEIKILTLREADSKYNAIARPDQLVEFWRREVPQSSWYDPEKEQLVVVSLDAKLNIKTFNLISIGLANQTLVHAREVFRPAIISAAVQIVIMHNHPSGNPTPSEDDIRTTLQIKKAGEILGIPCVDSIIVGEARGTDRGYCSSKESGIL